MQPTNNATLQLATNQPTVLDDVLVLVVVVVVGGRGRGDCLVRQGG